MRYEVSSSSSPAWRASQAVRVGILAPTDRGLVLDHRPVDPLIAVGQGCLMQIMTVQAPVA